MDREVTGHPRRGASVSVRSSLRAAWRVQPGTPAQAMMPGEMRVGALAVRIRRCRRGETGPSRHGTGEEKRAGARRARRTPPGFGGSGGVPTGAIHRDVGHVVRRAARCADVPGRIADPLQSPHASLDSHFRCTRPSATHSPTCRMSPSPSCSDRARGAPPTRAATSTSRSPSHEVGGRERTRSAPSFHGSRRRPGGASTSSSSTTLTPGLAYRVFRDGVAVLVRDRSALVERKARAILEYLDFRPVEEASSKAVLARRSR